jgi:hypothetical protein
MLRKLVAMMRNECDKILNNEICNGSFHKEPVGVIHDWNIESIESIDGYSVDPIKGGITEKVKVAMWSEVSEDPSTEEIMELHDAIALIGQALKDRVMERLEWERSNNEHKFR